jgi:hypothetical protein
VIVGEHVPISDISQGSVHDRKLGPVVIVDSIQAEREVMDTHPGQHTHFVMQGLGDQYGFLRRCGSKKCR